MYKDKDKQREAQREWIRRKRAEQSSKEFKERVEGSFEGSTPKGSTSLHPAIIATINRLTTRPDGTIDQQARTNRMAIAENYQGLYPEQQYTGVGIAPEEMPVNPKLVRVSKPGDADYKPLCQTTCEVGGRRPFDFDER